MSSVPYLYKPLQHLQAQFLTITTANGYYYNVTADNILDIKRDLLTEGSGDPTHPLNLSLYIRSFDKKNPGDGANFGQVEADVHCCVDFTIAIQSDTNLELAQAVADLERAIKQDYSQGGTCRNTTTPTLEVGAFDPSGLVCGTLSFDVRVCWAENNPSAEFSTTYN